MAIRLVRRENRTLWMPHEAPGVLRDRLKKEIVKAIASRDDDRVALLIDLWREFRPSIFSVSDLCYKTGINRSLVIDAVRRVRTNTRRRNARTSAGARRAVGKE